MEKNIDRIEKLLGLLLINSMANNKQGEKVKALNVAGFTNFEIAELLNIRAQVIANYLYKSRKTK